ncbi:MAG: ABC1 kinase family protein [Mycobacteriales bacterium]
MSINPVLFVLITIVTVVLVVAAFVGVSRRLLGFPVGILRALTAAALAIVVASALNRGALARPAYLPIEIGVAVVVAMTFLVIAEVLVPTGSLPSPWQWRGLGRRRLARTRRYAQISSIAARNGIGRLVRGDTRKSPAGRARVASSVRQALEQGGVTFVKLGQLMSGRSDLLPAEFLAELARLQDRVAPAPWSAVRELLVAELGARPEEVFAAFDPTPVAAGSIAQVHRATLANGEPVAVKVQRPGIRPVVEGDLDMIGRIARTLYRRTSWARSLGLVDLTDGFAAALVEELDFRVEARNMAAVALGARSRDGDAAVVVPAVYPAWCTERVLVMQWVDGTPLASVPTGDEVGDRTALARGLLDWMLRQVLIDGVFHADPHPGNVVLHADRRLALLDFGSVGRLDALRREGIAALLLALERADPAAARDAFLDVVHRPEELDEQRLERSLGQFMARHLGSVADLDAAMFTDLLKLVSSYGLAIPPEVAAVFRALATVEGTLAAFAPRFSMVDEARAFAAREVAARRDPRSAAHTLGEELQAALPVLRRLPRRFDRISGALEEGRLGVGVRLFADERDRRFVIDVLHLVVIAFLGATAGIMAVILLGSRGGPSVTHTVSLYQILGYNLLVISSVLVLRALFVIFHRGRPP